MTQPSESSMTFWQHLDALRSVIIRMAMTITVAGVVMFIAMPWIFDHIILWPCRDDFPLYRLFDMSAVTGESAGTPFSVSLININLGSQLMVQMSTSMHLALVVTFPVLIAMLWSFVSPGLYPREKRHARRAFLFATTMFYLGVATAYIMVFPITLRFLSQYQLSGLITNTITLDSYIDNFMTITLIMGIVFAKLSIAVNKLVKIQKAEVSQRIRTEKAKEKYNQRLAEYAQKNAPQPQPQAFQAEVSDDYEVCF